MSPARQSIASASEPKAAKESSAKLRKAPQVLGNLLDQTLERQLAEQKICGLLILSDLSSEKKMAGRSSKARKASVPGRKRCVFFMVPTTGASNQRLFQSLHAFGRALTLLQAT